MFVCAWVGVGRSSRTAARATGRLARVEKRAPDGQRSFCHTQSERREKEMERRSWRQSECCGNSALMCPVHVPCHFFLALTHVRGHRNYLQKTCVAPTICVGVSGGTHVSATSTARQPLFLSGVL